jgi:hypothetical protein
MSERAPHIIGANGRRHRIQYSVNEVIKHNSRRPVSTANGSERSLCPKTLATARGAAPDKYQKAWLTVVFTSSFEYLSSNFVRIDCSTPGIQQESFSQKIKG